LDGSGPGTTFNKDRDTSKLSVAPPELSLFRGENISATVGLDFDECLLEGGMEKLEELDW
jgi:hypothetical protein